MEDETKIAIVGIMCVTTIVVGLIINGFHDQTIQQSYRLQCLDQKGHLDRVANSSDTDFTCNFN